MESLLFNLLKPFIYKINLFEGTMDKNKMPGQWFNIGLLSSNILK